ncbi:hypothetical protein AhaeAN59_13870 [Acinetobacter haemolyticus]|uniref:Uncharacterized protein n=1 Tax=Acinetobacter haemolyticus TaxID=29430 RepID=A0A857IMY4_ACIHA|nr:hypothetical protein AhaeAN59_13870 [Acinetobacter haemolyticus]QHI14355.1 hypothetical protein AhaeAN43_13790 [Acinetobacter haemolyticus]
MFITSFGEQNITYKCCSNFLIHLSYILLIVNNIYYLLSAPPSSSNKVFNHMTLIIDVSKDVSKYT